MIGDVLNHAESSLGSIKRAGAKSSQRTVEVVSNADQRQMGEGPRKVSLLRSGLADLLGVQADMIAIGKHLVKAICASSSRPARAKASTCQNEHTVKVPSRRLVSGS